MRVGTPESVRRGLGSPALFGIVQGFIAASIYFALGLIGERALGWTWVVLLAAGLFFILLVLSYVEGASLHQERGGATVIARYAFNELWSFIAGWAVLLDYLILIALCAFTTADYAAVFWAPLGTGAGELLLSLGVVAYVTVVNVRGVGPRRFDVTALLILFDLALQVVIVGLGLILLFEPSVLSDPAAVAGTPEWHDVVFAFTLAIVAFTGLDASSGLAGQVAIGRRGLRRLIGVRMIAAVVPYVGLSLLAVSVLPLNDLGDTVEAPMLGVVGAFEQEWTRDALRYLVAASAVGVLAFTCNAAMLGLSRLGYNLAINRQIPAALGRLHPTRSTPIVVIAIGALLAAALVLPTDLDFLAGTYAFGATIAFTLVTLGTCVLRWREPDRDRPFKIPLNVRLRGGELPLPAALGALVSFAAFLSVVTLHSEARVVGFAWMAFGVTLYVWYRVADDKPILRRVTVPEQSLTGGRSDVEYGKILVPIFGTALDDDIMQTAGRLAGIESEEEWEGGHANIEAVWVFEVPMSLPLDARLPEELTGRAKAALARAKAVGEEYEGVVVHTNTVRARKLGEGIVAEARRKGVEAIVTAAEEPTRLRGGLALGGKIGLRDTFVGEATRYVIEKAPCRVILTAPAEMPDPDAPAGAQEEPAPPDGGVDGASDLG